MGQTARDDNKSKKGCWYTFTSTVWGLWSTREMRHVDKADKPTYARTTLRELVVYCLFIVLLCVMTFGMTSPMQYYYADIISGLFIKGKNVTTIDKFWSFMEKEFLDNLYFEYKYRGGDARNFHCPGGDDVVGPCPVANEDRNVLYENRLLGVPRLRQIRVRNDTCVIHPSLHRLVTKACYGDYAEGHEDRDRFNASSIVLNHTTLTAWSYQSSDSLSNPSTTGQMATYGGGGSVQDLNSVKNTSRLIIRELKEGLWITRGTRVIFVDFTLYNANLNLFCIVKMTFEMPPTGGVFARLEFNPTKLLRYVDTTDYFILGCEFVYVLFIVYYVVEELIEIGHNRFVYFANVWNLLDLTVIVVSVVNVSLIAYATYTIEMKIGELLSRPDEYADFVYLGYWSTHTDNALALCLFFTWIKLLKYITFNRTMTQLSRTLAKCAKDVAGFGFMFTVAFLAFAQFGHIVFGSEMQEYSSVTDSVFTLLRTILGDFNFRLLQKTQPVLGPMYFTVYVICVFFVLLNMFLAIINDTYSLVKAELSSKKLDFDLGAYFSRGFNNVLVSLGSRSKVRDIEEAFRSAYLDDGKITYEEIRQNMKKSNFSDLEIEIFFAKYDKGGGEFDADEAEEILDDLECTFEEAIADGTFEAEEDGNGSGKFKFATKIVTLDDLDEMTEKVDNMEADIERIVAKIDAVFRKMKKMEGKRREKREKMDKIFDPKRRESCIRNEL